MISRPHLRRPLALCVLCAVVVTSLALAGCKGNGNGDANASTRTSTSASTGAAMSVNIEANEKGFTPTSFDLQKGAPATLIFRRTSDATCATQVVFPELKITKDLPLNVPVPVTVPTGDARTLSFQCGMGMFKGKIVIH